MKIHARITKEIDVTEEEMKVIVKASNSNEHSLNEDEKLIFNNIRNKLIGDIDSGNYESGYIPGEWICSDAGSLTDGFSCEDIEL